MALDQGQTFQWMVEELQRLRAENERLQARVAEMAIALGRKAAAESDEEAGRPTSVDPTIYGAANGEGG